MLGWAVMCLGGVSWAARAVPVDFARPYLDLRPAMQVVRARSAKAVITVPQGPGGQGARVTLTATGKGKEHVWLVFSLLNLSDKTAHLALETALARIAGARLAPLQVPAAILSTGATGTAGFVRDGPGQFRITAPARGVSTYFLEVSSPRMKLARLWHAPAREGARLGELFFAGLLAGIGMLAVIGFLALYALRPLPAVLPAALFALGASGFVLVNSGGWQVLLPAIRGGGLMRLEVFSEALMLTGLGLWLIFWLEVPRRSRLLAGIGLSMCALFAGLAVWGLFAPAQAVLFVRPALFGLTLAAPLPALAGAIRRRAFDGGGLLTLGLLLIWAIWTALALFGLVPAASAGQVSSALLILAVLSLAAVMVRASLSPAAALRRFITGSGRQALALTAAGLSVWDYDPVSGILHTSEGLEHNLGLPPGTLAHGGLQSFLARMHPADTAPYQAAVEAAAHHGKRPFSVQFRLRRADGGYRWYLLRARPMSDGGHAGPAMRLIGVLSDITGIKRSEERILSDAVRDRVTGLPNRPLLIDRLTRAIARAQGTSASLYLLVLDIDRFRTINDAWGFETGDALLRQMARRLSGLLEPEDTLARLPGDQFAIIADASARPRDIIAFAERLRAGLARPFDLGVREISLTVCIGITHLRGAEAMEAEDAIKQAEIALFEARKRGNDAVAFFEKSMLAGRSREVSLEQDLRRAVERGEIEVVYQPIMYLADGQLAGFEALVRWRHPLHGVLGPDSFISLAEEIGMIGDIGEVALHEAVRHLGVWQRAFRPERPLFVAVNISSAQLLNASLVDDVAALLNREGIAPETLKLELTESLIMENPELGRKILTRIANLGVRIACDDFGTGYSSLSNLRNLPFSTLKIDRAFVDTGPDDAAAAIILESIVRMAHGLGMDIVAEGIETQEQMRRMANLGCDMGQGWLIGAPVSARRVMEAFTGASLTPSAKSRFRAILERLAGAPGDTHEDHPLNLPPVPMPAGPAPLAETASQDDAARRPPERDAPDKAAADEKDAPDDQIPDEQGTGDEQGAKKS